MSRFLIILQATLRTLILASIVAVLISAAALLRRADQVMAAMPALVERQIQEQGNALRNTAQKEIADTRRDTVREFRRTRELLLSQTAVSLNRLDTRAEAAQQTLDRQVTTVSDTLHHISSVADQTQPVLHESARMVSQLNEALPLFLDCDHNPDCVFNRYVGTSKGVERAADAIGKAAPGTAAAVESTSRSVAKVADEYTRKAPLYKQILDWGVRGLILWKIF